MVTDRAHRLGMHISHINARNTSKLAYDGSGGIDRGWKACYKTYSVCKFASGKIYNCDLNASYDIGWNLRQKSLKLLREAPAHCLH